jgi:hypothetical protein
MSYGNRLNIRGIIDLDQMSAVISGLMDRLDKQELFIIDLQQKLETCTCNEKFYSQVHLLEESIYKTNDRLDAVQIASTAKVMNKK